jgi:HK97 family phage major capsid protein
MKNDLIRKRVNAYEKRNGVMTTRQSALLPATTEARGLTADELTADDKAQADIATIDAEIRSLDAQIQGLEMEGQTGGEERDLGNAGATDSPETRNDPTGDFYAGDEYRSLFVDWLKGKRSHAAIASEIGSHAELNAEMRAFGRDAATKGQPVVPRNFMKLLVTLLTQEAGLVSEIPIQVIDSEKSFAVETGLGTAAYRVPGGAYAEGDPTLTSGTVDIFDLGRLLKVDEELLDDMAIDLLPYFAENFATVFGLHMETQAIDGTSADAAGPASILAGVGNLASAAVAVLTNDDLINVRAVPLRAARNGGKYLFNTNTETSLLLLKDTTGRALWQPSIREGEPGRINGDGYVLSDSMPDVATAAKSVAYGPWKRYVKNYVRRNMTMRRLNELFAGTGQVGFRGQLRHDFHNHMPTAFATITIA